VQTSKKQNVTSVQKVVYSYKGNPVQFIVNGKLTINATEMAKPFGKAKHPKNWLRNQQTQDFLTELSKVRICALADLVQVKYGGANPGTWMHEDVALEFARWLSPSFAIWCNDRIKELLSGFHTMPTLAKAKREVKQLPQQITIEGMPIEEYMKMHSEITIQRKKNYEERNRDIPLLGPGLTTFIWWTEAPLETNIKNLLAIMNNNLMEGTFYYYEYMKLLQIVKSYKQDAQKLSDLLYSKYKIYPNT